MKKRFLASALSLAFCAPATATVPMTSSSMSFTGALKLKAARQAERTNAKGDIIGKLNFGAQEPANWFNLSPALDSTEGVGTERAYDGFGAPATQVVVAVIDSGVDVNHEDLQGKVWVNEDEIADNGIDDDKNGYIDDVFGWNFIGNSEGMAQVIAADNSNGYTLVKGDPSKQVDADSLEITREYTRLKKRYEDLSSQGRYLPAADRIKLEELKKEIDYERFRAGQSLERYSKLKNSWENSHKILSIAGIDPADERALARFKPNNEKESKAKEEMTLLLRQGYSKEEIEDSYIYYLAKHKYHFNPESDTRAEIVRDDIDDKNQRVYGNNDVIGPDSSHGTHVAGTIAAARDNGIGINGVASNVKIMALRAVPNGDERDKDVANAIYYAVDNGARVINMSFGKAYSPYKSIVDRAVKYAEEKGVLLVHAAGNSSQNNDTEPNFPNRKTNSGEAKNWIEVGASTHEKGPYLAAGFSNFGKTSVDVFAPGQNIKATFPNNAYETISGTSMAAPVVSGVAAALIGHFPKASATTIKRAILQSATLYPGLFVYKRGAGMVNFDELSSTGGVANLYKAIEYLREQAPGPISLRLASF